MCFLEQLESPLWYEARLILEYFYSKPFWWKKSRKLTICAVHSKYPSSKLSAILKWQKINDFFAFEILMLRHLHKHGDKETLDTRLLRNFSESNNKLGKWKHFLNVTQSQKKHKRQKEKLKFEFRVLLIGLNLVLKFVFVWQSNHNNLYVVSLHSTNLYSGT